MSKLSPTSWQVALVAIYILAVTITTAFSGALGPLASVIDSLPGIGLVIVVRNRLHDTWGDGLSSRMVVLIFYGSLGSLAANLSHPRIAIASCVAFATANVLAALLYKHNKVASVLAFAVVDSLVFPTIAFASFIWWVVAGQALAKVLGAAIWTLVFRAFRSS